MQAMNFTVFDANGRILRFGSVPADDFPNQARQGEFILEGAPPVEDCYVSDGQFVAIPSRPSRHHVFDYAVKQWIDPRTLTELKAQKWEQIRRERDLREFGGFQWDGSTFDSDSASQSRIMGAVQLAQLNSSFAIDWTLSDNTVRTLSAANMIAVGIALGQHVALQHATARTLRAQIESAQTATAIESITWP